MRWLLVAVTAFGCVDEEAPATIEKIHACADQQRLWCELAGRPDEVDCWNIYFDWCMPKPRLQAHNVDIPIELQDACMTDLLGTTEAPLNHWLPDRETVPESCQAIWNF